MTIPKINKSNPQITLYAITQNILSVHVFQTSDEQNPVKQNQRKKIKPKTVVQVFNIS